VSPELPCLTAAAFLRGSPRLRRGGNGLHRSGLAVGERLYRELQRPAARRGPEQRDLLLAEGGADHHRDLAAALQSVPPTCLARLPRSSTRSVRTLPCGVVARTRWGRCDGHAPTGTEAHHERTFAPDHSVGAGQHDRQACHSPSAPVASTLARTSLEKVRSVRWRISEKGGDVMSNWLISFTVALLTLVASSATQARDQISVPFDVFSSVYQSEAGVATRSKTQSSKPAKSIAQRNCLRAGQRCFPGRDICCHPNSCNGDGRGGWVCRRWR